MHVGINRRALLQLVPSGHHACTHRVPYLQLDLLAVYVDHARAKLHANGQIMHWLEPLVSELQQKA